MTQLCPIKRLKVGKKPKTTYYMRLQYQKCSTYQYELEIQLNLFKINGCHGNHEHPTSLIWMGVLKNSLEK